MAYSARLSAAAEPTLSSITASGNSRASKRARTRVSMASPTVQMPAPTASIGPHRRPIWGMASRSPPAAIRSGAALVHRGRAVDQARRHQALPERERLLEDGHHHRARQVDALLVALEAQDLVAIDGERQSLEDDRGAGEEGERGAVTARGGSAPRRR